MPKAKKLDGRAVCELFVGLSLREQGEFYSQCVSPNAPDNLIRIMDATLTKAVKDNGKVAMRFRRDGQRPKAVRDDLIVALRDGQIMTFGQIGRDVRIVKLNDGERMDSPAVKRAYDRAKGRAAR